MDGSYAIEWTNEGVPVSLQQFGFHYGNGQAKTIAGKMDNSQTPHLANCFVGWIGGTPIILSGPIDSEQKVLEWIQLLKEIVPLNRPFLISLNQLASLHKEWHTLSLQKKVLAYAKSRKLVPKDALFCSCTPIDSLYSFTPPRNESLSEIKAYRALLRLFNAESSSLYCSSFNVLLESVYHEFKYDATDAYTLERYIKDFEHEAKNPFLERTKERLMDLEASGAFNELGVSSYHESVRVEKEILRLEEDIRRMISAHYDALSEMIRIIPIIESSHPSLKKINNSAKILKGLLELEVATPDKASLSFAQEQMLLQLLNDALGVTSTMCADFGLQRAGLAFTIRATTLQLASQAPLEEVIDLALNWKEASRTLHKAAYEKGINGFEEWKKNLKNPRFQAQATLLLKFWELFSLNLKHLFTPLTKYSSSDKNLSASEKVNYNQELLALFPPFASYLGRPVYPLYLNYDPNSMEPVSLTAEGKQLLNLPF